MAPIASRGSKDFHSPKRKNGGFVSVLGRWGATDTKSMAVSFLERGNRMSSKIALLVPEGRVRAVPIAPPPRLGELKGKVIGFLHNGKPNADILLARLADLLREKHALAQARIRSKPRVTEPAEFIEELAGECHGVVNALGD
jgi:hypothetical protein